MAATLSRVTGAAVSYTVVPPVAYARRLVAARAPAGYIIASLLLHGLPRLSPPPPPPAADYELVTGRPPTRLAEFCAEHAHVWAAASGGSGGGGCAVINSGGEAAVATVAAAQPPASTAASSAAFCGSSVSTQSQA